MTTKKFLTARECADYIGLTLSYLYKLTASHKIPFYAPTGRKVVFKTSEIDEWIEKSRQSTYEELEEKAQTSVVMKP
ncbi:MAG: excisionase family DNA-binding protein [Prevotella sp.]|nr:excisionase family DNA-binding protein [Prevotella sp.]